MTTHTHGREEPCEWTEAPGASRQMDAMKTWPNHFCHILVLTDNEPQRVCVNTELVRAVYRCTHADHDPQLIMEFIDGVKWEIQDDGMWGV